MDKIKHMIKKKINCVLLGLGNQACEHLEASRGHDEVAIIAGVDLDEDRRNFVQTKYTDLSLQTFKDLSALQNCGIQFDAFILALPHHAYQDIWQSIVNFRKPLLKEKPLGRDYHEAHDFMQQAKNNQCGLMTAIQRRSHPSYQYLAQYILEHKLTVDEIHAHLHLGKGKVDDCHSEKLQDVQDNPNWRDSRSKAGGGALLDAGYHMIDLLIFLIGDFDIISATMWNGQKVDNGRDIEDRSWILARSAQTWIDVDIWVKGHEDGKGGYQKSEGWLLRCGEQLIKANRHGVWLNDKQLYQTNRDWKTAMQQQLNDFAMRIKTKDWDDDVIWEQLPIQRKIDYAYSISKQF